MGRRKVTSQGFRLSVSELDDFYSDYKSIRPESTMSKKQFAKRVEQSYNYFSRLYEQEKSKGRALYVKDSPASYTNQYLNYISMGNSKDIAKQRIRAHIQTTYAEARELAKRGTAFLHRTMESQSPSLPRSAAIRHFHAGCSIRHQSTSCGLARILRSKFACFHRRAHKSGVHES